MTATLRPAPLDHRRLEEAAEMIRVLGHPVRLRIVEYLEGTERTVSQLVADLRAPQAIVSQQLAKMRNAGIVACRREGNSVWYRVADDRVVRMLGCLRQCNT